MKTTEKKYYKLFRTNGTAIIDETYTYNAPIEEGSIISVNLKEKAHQCNNAINFYVNTPADAAYCYVDDNIRIFEIQPITRAYKGYSQSAFVPGRNFMFAKSIKLIKEIKNFEFKRNEYWDYEFIIID